MKVIHLIIQGLKPRAAIRRGWRAPGRAGLGEGSETDGGAGEQQGTDTIEMSRGGGGGGSRI